MKIGVIVGILTLILMIIGIFFGIEAQIELTVYFGIFLVIFAGSVGVTFITRRFEAMICGLIIGALWPVLLEAIKAAGLI